MAALTAITAAFLSMVSIQTKGGGYDMLNHKALWLAEAGLQKAVWNLKTPVVSGGRGENWTTTGTTENLGSGTYNIKVERWDWALAANGATASASSSATDKPAGNAFDGNDTTYWQSASKPLPSSPEYITVTFPYRLTMNKVRFLVPPGSSQQSPKDYDWQVSINGITYTTVLSQTGNNATDVTDEFSAVSNVAYLRLRVTKVGGGFSGVIVSTLEAIGAKVSSTGSVGAFNRKIEQTVVADETTQTASNERDWNEIVPAI